MNYLLIGLLGALLSTNQPGAVSNLVLQTTGVHVRVPDPNDPVEKTYHKLMEEDDAAEDEVDHWIKEARNSGSKQANDTLSLRIRARIDPIRHAYQDFLALHPDHARARIAYGSFLNDLGEEEEAVQQWEKARETDPTIPSVWNNLANYYGHRSPVKKSFEYYPKAIELDPKESVYYWNFATTVYLFRKDAMEYYHIDETQVFDKALDLYRAALRLDPTNFILASDYAETFYVTKPPRLEEGLGAWREAMKLAPSDVEKEGVLIHYARIEINLHRFAEAQRDLDSVTNEVYATLRGPLQKKLKNDMARLATNNPSATPPTSPAEGHP